MNDLRDKIALLLDEQNVHAETSLDYLADAILALIRENVPPLVWSEDTTMFKGSFKREGWSAKHPFGWYFISNHEDDERLSNPATPHFLVTSQGDTGPCVRKQHGRFNTLEAAKAAANEHHVNAAMKLVGLNHE